MKNALFAFAPFVACVVHGQQPAQDSTSAIISGTAVLKVRTFSGVLKSVTEGNVPVSGVYFMRLRLLVICAGVHLNRFLPGREKGMRRSSVPIVHRWASRGGANSISKARLDVIEKGVSSGNLH